jgi:hypothetical protein
MFDAGDVKTAKLQLAWVVENGKGELRELARLRLAALLLDEKAYDEALKQLDGTPSAGISRLVSRTAGATFSPLRAGLPRRARPTSRYSPHSNAARPGRKRRRDRRKPPTANRCS